MIEKIEDMMKYETAGDPMGNLKWTRKTAQKIADELGTIGIGISKTTVGKILEKLGFSLKTNRKKISNGGRPLTKKERKKRDSQFKYISEIRNIFNEQNKPAVSVDSKKKEITGNFKNQGTRYKREADLTNDHDFLTYAIGKAALYGVYDQQENRGFVSVGMFLREGKCISSGDTPEFAVESVERRWKYEGAETYQNQNEILILADAGGSNGY
ncbi:MAG: ISAzo13 family transposase, partial [Lentisphaerae bacterium]|nr:ISAzo13 family transposase [Lentisphaerota bacterium]